MSKKELSTIKYLFCLICLISVLVASCSRLASNDVNSVQQSSSIESTDDAGTAENPPQDYGSNSPVFIVIPTYELQDMIERYEKGENVTQQDEANFAQSRMELLALKANGTTRWNSQQWMKEPNYYKSLNTFELAEECFSASRSVFYNEMAIYNNPGLRDNARYAFEVLKVFHNGFAELAERENMWKGILHVYEYLSSKLDTESDLGQIVLVSGHFGQLWKLYLLSPLREQVKNGREGLFLAANLQTLKRFCWYLDNYDSEKMGGSPGFFREPCTVAQVALLLAKQVNPQRYAEIEPEITNIRWTREQKVEDLRSFLNLVVTELDSFVTEQDRDSLLKIQQE